jgi:Zn-dependent protease with chaperone function
MQTEVPARRGSLAARAVLAVVLLVGFYALALAIAGGLLYLVYLMVAVANRVNARLLIAALIGAGAILWGIVPRPDRFEPPGPRLLPERHSRLFALLREVAQACRQSMPVEVYLVGDVNAFVTQRGGIMGIGSRRVMGLGLPLLRVLPVGQLRAVIAHEFGHYHGGDVALGPWIYKTRSAIGRTLDTLARAGSSLLHKPFEWYGTLFLRVTMALSRRQETEADQLAARVAGTAQMCAGLKNVERASFAYAAYLQNEVGPVLGAGYRPPLAEGFARFFSARALASKLDAQVVEAMASEAANPYDSHPSLKERLSMLERASVVPEVASRLGDDASALELLDGVPALEAELVGFLMVDPEKAAALKPVGWEDVGERVYPELWKARADEHSKHLVGLTAASLPVDRGAVLRWARPVLGARAPDEVAAVFAAFVMASALASKLVESGWRASALPGEDAVLKRDGKTFEPFLFVRVATGTAPPEAWRDACRAAGVEDVALASASD